jgi:hypothetical protein
MNTSWRRALARVAACVLLMSACIGAVHASALRAYMSSASGEPFNDFSNVDAMNAAFGSGGAAGSGWDQLRYGDAFDGYGMLYIDGGSTTAADMVTFLDSSRSALEAFVFGGGRLFINAATENLATIDLVFGATLNEQDIDHRGLRGSAVDGSNQLFSGAGTAWDGFFFSHDDIGLAPGYSSLIVDEIGRTVLAGGFFGTGYAMLGGQTNTAFHDPSNLAVSDPFQLRVNELLYVDQVTPTVAVPEPGTLALVLAAGLAVARRRRPVARRN